MDGNLVIELYPLVLPHASPLLLCSRSQPYGIVLLENSGVR